MACRAANERQRERETERERERERERGPFSFLGSVTPTLQRQPPRLKNKGRWHKRLAARVICVGYYHSAAGLGGFSTRLVYFSLHQTAMLLHREIMRREENRCLSPFLGGRGRFHLFLRPFCLCCAMLPLSSDKCVIFKGERHYLR